MQHDPAAHLDDVVTSVDLILEYVQGVDAEDYRHDQRLQDAVERRFTIIGEALARLARDAPDLHARIEHSGPIRRFRNIVVHNYDAVDPAIVLGIIRDDLSPLRARAADILREITDERLTQGST